MKLIDIDVKVKSAAASTDGSQETNVDPAQQGNRLFRKRAFLDKKKSCSRICG